jgi:L-aminopeptidase/D-esterase-like protein/N-acyl-D-aspartate/D-glutamate deacylase
LPTPSTSADVPRRGAPGDATPGCFFLAVALCALAISPPTPNAAAQPALSFVIVNASLVDGTGAPARPAAVRVTDGRIAEVGDVRPTAGDHVVDARGLVLAPGFIDPHNHSTDGLLTEPLAPTQISQGITTVVVGQDGSSPWPIGEYLDRLRRNPPSLNVMTAVGHATVRRVVMGDDYKRQARAEEVTRMSALVEQGMREGAIALSSGLEYEVGGYAGTEELIALAGAAGREGGFYISHIRDEADKTFEAMREVIAIGERAGLPVQNTHIKLGTVGVWRRAAEAIAMFDTARARGLDVTADAYPYDAWSSTITVLIPSKRYDDPVDVARGLADVGGAHNVLITRHAAHPEYEYKTLAAVAQTQGITPVALFSQIVKDGGASVVCTAMVDEDIRAFFQWPWTMVSSDGGIGMRHPRGAGSFPRVLGRFVRERKWLTLEAAIYKMTALPAARLKLTDRGAVRPGAWADLVLFDPATVIDRSTFSEPFTLSTGVRNVWVNGALVWDEPRTPGARPGQVIAPGRSPRGAVKPRARDLGVPFDGTPGIFNAITDVGGVEVGVTTLVAGDGALARGKGPVRTGVTAVLPRGRSGDFVFAGWHALNGNGEMTGTTWITESGFLEGPILITNTHSVGVARDAAVEWMARYSEIVPLPVAAETYDGSLNDILGFHVRREHVLAALDGAAPGALPEGNVGGGTGMIAFGFKGGTGTASRVVSVRDATYRVGALVQANFGRRQQLLVAGAPVGREIPDLMPETGRKPAAQDDASESGSIIVVIATDAPLLPHQLRRLAQRAGLGVARLGGTGGNGSGDIFVAFSTANPGTYARPATASVTMLANDAIDPLFQGAIQATEEAVVNAMVAAETMTGRDGNRVHALPHDRLRAALKKYNRLSP